ncbi:hypothetical protein L208DRAFT_1266669, partial [Tricholoma matsutake]
ELKRYFTELETLLTAYNITDSTEQKAHTCHYVEVKSADFWQSLPEFAATHTYIQWWDEIVKCYPGAVDNLRWTLNDLDCLLGEQARIGIYTMEDLTSYYHDFYTISNFLISKGYTLPIEQAKSFYHGFQPRLWSKVQNHLYTSNPKCNVNKPWELPLVFDAAKLIINLSNTGGPASSHPSFIVFEGPVHGYITVFWNFEM